DQQVADGGGRYPPQGRDPPSEHRLPRSATEHGALRRERVDVLQDGAAGVLIGCRVQEPPDLVFGSEAPGVLGHAVVAVRKGIGRVDPGRDEQPGESIWGLGYRDPAVCGPNHGRPAVVAPHEDRTAEAWARDPS